MTVTVDTATITDRTDTVGQPALEKMAAVVPVLAAVWCRSVGTSWTVEVH